MDIEKIILENFNCFGGKHCQTTALKSILEYHNLNLSEEMLFGLGGGVGFIYWHTKKMPAPFIGCRNSKVDEFVVKICKRIGAEAILWQTGNAEKSYEEVKKLLRSGEPVYVFVDMAYLPYMALPSEAHFGGHAVTVFGIDEQENKVYIADRGKKAVFVSIGDFKKARSSKFPPFPAKNKLFKIKCPPIIPDLKECIKNGIKECCDAMINPPIKNIGLSGMQKWVGLIPKWNEQFKGMNLLECLLNTFIYIEIGGTGGGAFRPMYAKFLRESAEILNSPKLSEVAEIFEKSSVKWTEIASATLPDEIPELRKTRELLFQKNKIFEEQEPDTIEKMKKINIEINGLTKKAVNCLRENHSLLVNLQQKILDCYETEKQAFLLLSKSNIF
ncbi:MAG: BtrH N-terminal domain-containing protein [Elusimicrobia bacterium]|nr:BtrH N-terminal domain-containing protein [Elusimicrobiota bacterium]